MDLSWQLRPTWIRIWPNNVRYALFVDESGSSEIPRRPKALAEWRSEPQYFSLAGVMIDRENYFDVFRPLMTSLKERFWPPDGMFPYPAGVRRVVLHSRDIRRKEGPFASTIIDSSELYAEIADMIEATPFKAFAAVLDMMRLEGSLPTQTLPFRDQPYSLATHFILERYAQYLRTHKESGVVILEARGKKEDRVVLSNMVKLLNEHPREFYCIEAIYWVQKWPEWDDKTSFGALEIADLIAYPVYQFVRSHQKGTAFEIIEPKLYGYPSYMGRGLKVF